MLPRRISRCVKCMSSFVRCAAWPQQTSAIQSIKKMPQATRGRAQSDADAMAVLKSFYQFNGESASTTKRAHPHTHTHMLTWPPFAQVQRRRHLLPSNPVPESVARTHTVALKACTNMRDAGWSDGGGGWGGFAECVPAMSIKRMYSEKLHANCLTQFHVRLSVRLCVMAFKVFASYINYVAHAQPIYAPSARRKL